MNAMVVDDSLIMRKNIRKMLLRLDWTIIGDAKNGMEAIELYERDEPDLVTMDITMPIMDGIDAVRLIVQDYPKANVIMITSHGQEDMVREAIKNGAKGYILKPITEEKLAQSIIKLFGDLAPHTVENETIDETLDDDMLDYEILED